MIKDQKSKKVIGWPKKILGGLKKIPDLIALLLGIASLACGGFLLWGNYGFFVLGICLVGFAFILSKIGRRLKKGR